MALFTSTGTDTTATALDGWTYYVCTHPGLFCHILPPKTAYLPSSKLPKKLPASTERKYPTLNVMTASILRLIRAFLSSVAYPGWKKTHSRYPTPTISKSSTALVPSTLSRHGLACALTVRRRLSSATGTISALASAKSILPWWVPNFEFLYLGPTIIEECQTCISSTPLSASRQRKVSVRRIRKMQVPAYWPVEVGIQYVEYKGVFVEVKNVIAIEEEEEEEPMSDMEEEEESMPDIEEEEAAEADVGEAIEAMAGDMDMLDIEDMFDSLVGCRIRFGDPSVLDYGGYRLLVCAGNEIIMSDG